MLAQGRGMSAVCVGGWSCRSHGALVARSRRAARAARGPRGRGAARPNPRTPTRGKLSLQAFARCARVLRFAQGVSVLAHGTTRRVCAGAWCDPPCARWWRAPSAPLALLAAPEGRGCAPLPPDPHPRQAELAGFCALPRACCASRRCFCAGARGHPPCCRLSSPGRGRVRC